MSFPLWGPVSWGPYEVLPNNGMQDRAGLVEMVDVATRLAEFGKHGGAVLGVFGFERGGVPQVQRL